MAKRAKTGGRKKGTPNKTTTELRSMVTKFTIENFPEFQNAFSDLSAKGKVFAFLRLLKFSIPEYGSITDSIQNLPEHDLEFLLERFKQKINGQEDTN